MRVVGGKYKRTNLFTLKGDDITRPTKDMVKEAVFSSVDVEGKRVLDLFAGSGAIGIEAISRGAKDVIFNDKNKDAVVMIRKNLAHINEDRTIFQKDHLDFLRSYNGEAFDFIYLDPPYAFDSHGEIFDLLEENKLVKKGTLVLCEIGPKRELKDSYGPFCLYKTKKYGITRVIYYSR